MEKSEVRAIVNENADLLSRRWREVRQGLRYYPERFDGRRFDALSKLVASFARKSLERQIAQRAWSDERHAA
jgi:hypothetical protein